MERPLKKDDEIEVSLEFRDFEKSENLLAVKRLVWAHINDSNLDAVRDRERAEFSAAMKRPTFQEAVQSFMQKRQPDFHQQPDA